ncbi:molybdopterin-dependent oxidoreductase [Adlercreutzia sp. R25]|uniref:Molybdopterin-dependent oxidoreductase n=1 Tax=Adlercreutzia shanghongiae TaxID=3111773 RepID=A0ABU6IYE7_9ACTN|nr:MULTISPECIES: molybdopterin-dependent oxidoreductase [unclassified Adlercreutzia]MEC4271871.1 molybdopterin-dependent oxidoreductase [Adlercreutzia sp. R25]MEC4294874.1 molybdopterin-dependent oxidoreductase [Adlercreutzia sp. R22]
MEFKNDLGKPWRWEEDGLTVTRSCAWSAPGCHPVGCGLKYYVDKEGKLVKVEGDENHPVTKGRLCIRCLTLKDVIYHPDRVLYPMKRDPKDRGNADAWERISWDEAYELIESEYHRIVDEYGPNAICCWCGTGRQGGIMHPYPAAVFGTNNAVDCLSGAACYSPRNIECFAMLGGWYPEVDMAAQFKDTYDDPRYKVPECILLWGKAPLASNGDGLWGHGLIELMKRGTKLVVVDPRVTWLANKAEYHLQIWPGTDTALAMAMNHVMISEGLYDKEFVDQWTWGFEQFAERVATMPPERAAEICGITAEEIYEATRFYAKANPSAVMWGLGCDQQENACQLGQAMIGLMSLTGFLDAPGGTTVGGAEGYGNINFGTDKISEEVKMMTIGLDQYPCYCEFFQYGESSNALKAMETGEPYPIKMSMFTGNNMMVCNGAEPKRWHDALLGLEFNIGLDLWMTPSIQASCDVMLPLSTFVEQDGGVTPYYGGTNVYTGALNKAISVGECKSDLEITLELGRRIHPEWFEEIPDLNTWINEIEWAQKYDFKNISEEVVHQHGDDIFSYYKYKTGRQREDGQIGFETQSGRVELYTTLFEYYGEDPLPHYDPSNRSHEVLVDLKDKYPLKLTTGARNYAYFHSEGRQIPYLRETHPDPIVRIHPEDAAARDIHDGEWVVIENEIGKCQMRAEVTPIVKKGMAQADHGWWFPEMDGNEPTLYGAWKSNINLLLPTGPKYIGKLGLGAPYKCNICEITKGEVGINA